MGDAYHGMMGDVYRLRYASNVTLTIRRVLHDESLLGTLKIGDNPIIGTIKVEPSKLERDWRRERPGRGA